MPPRGKGERRQEGVSEVIGTLILVGAGITGMALVALLLLSQPQPGQLPVLDTLITNESTTIYLFHKGGDPLFDGQYQILVDGVDRTSDFNNTGGFSPSDLNWSVGETLYYASPTMPARVVIALIQPGSGGGGGGGGGGGSGGSGVFGSVIAAQDLAGSLVLPDEPQTYPTSSPCIWSYRKSITLDGSKVQGSLTNFPVLISLSDSDLQSHARSDGEDIFFTASDGSTNLSHEIESYSSGTLVAWVNVTSLPSGTDTMIYMYYGKQTLTGLQNPTGVWDDNYKAVWHLGSSLLDSTKNNNDGTDSGGSTSTTGQIASGRSFDGNNDYINFGTSTTLQPTELSITYWIKRTASWKYEYPIFFWAKGSSKTGNGWFIDSFDEYYGDNRPINLGVNGENYWNVMNIDPDTFYPLNGWTYMAVTFSSSANTAKALKDGVSQTFITYQSPDLISSSSDPKYLAAWPGDGIYTQGVFDEVRISATVRSNDWIKTEYNNQKTPSTFYKTIGSEEENPLC